MKKRVITPLDFYRTCYDLAPDILVSVYSATKDEMPLWTGEFRSMPVAYRDAIIDYMFICSDGSEIRKLIFALQDRSIDNGKA